MTERDRVLVVRFLGQFEVRLDNAPVEILLRAAQSLLGYLILTAGTAHRREKLAGLFWPDASETGARQSLRQEMHRLAEEGSTTQAAAALRARANSLVLRATQAALTASKGSGFMRQHAAQRWARQALFFLVWSCPRPAAEATLAALAPPEAFACP